MGPGLDVKLVLDLFNKAQQAYFLENDEFASDLSLLGVPELLTLINNYSEYEFDVEDNFTAFLYKPNAALGLKTYYAFVGVWGEDVFSLSTLAFLFESTTPGPHTLLTIPSYSLIDGSLISVPTSATTTFIETS